MKSEIVIRIVQGSLVQRLRSQFLEDDDSSVGDGVR